MNLQVTAQSYRQLIFNVRCFEKCRSLFTAEKSWLIYDKEARQADGSIKLQDLTRLHFKSW